MSLFRRPERRDWNAGSFPDALASLRYGTGGTTPNVTPATAEAHWAVSACINRYSDAVSILPLDAIRSTGTSRAEVSPSPVVLSRPSTVVDAPSWKAQIVRCMFLRGFGAGLASGQDPNHRYAPATLELISPDIVRFEWGEYGWRYFVNNREVLRWPDGPLWLVSGKHEPVGAPFGISVIEYARQSIATGFSAQNLASKTYTAGAPAGVLQTEQVLSRDQSDELGDRFDSRYAGGGKTAVISQGTTYQAIALKPSDSLFIDSQQWSSQQVCGFFDLDPTEIGSAPAGQKTLTYANRSDNAQQFLTKSLAPILNRIEWALSTLFPLDDINVKFNTGAILRADVATRYETYRVAKDAEILTVDEIRALEDLPPLEQTVVEDDATQRQLSVAEVVQKVYLGVDKVVTSDEARQIVNAAGGALAVPGPTFAVETPAAPAQEPQVVVNNAMSAPEVRVVLPESIDIPAPIVNVAAPDVRVNVAAPVVNVEAPPAPKSVRSVERDGDGRIKRIIEEPEHG